MPLRARLTARATTPALMTALEGVRPVVVREVEHGLAEGEDGARHHQPLTLVKEIDALSPALHAALLRREPFAELTLDLLGDGRQGETDGRVLRLRLLEARVSALRLRKLDPDAHPGRAHLDLEEVVLRYAAVEWTWSFGAPVTLRDAQAAQSERT